MVANAVNRTGLHPGGIQYVDSNVVVVDLSYILTTTI
jgi:hypothetical protein